MKNLKTIINIKKVWVIVFLSIISSLSGCGTSSSIDNNIIDGNTDTTSVQNSSYVELNSTILDNNSKLKLPVCSEDNPKVYFIEDASDWDKINDSDKSIFCVRAGNYKERTIELTTSGTSDERRYILLDNETDMHTGKLSKDKLAIVSFAIKSDYWTIDRMAYIDSPTDKSPIIISNGDYNIINRYYMHDVGGGIYIYPNSDDNTIQNCRIERDDISVHLDRAAIALYNHGLSNISIKNNKIINNEICNFVDGFQTIRQPESSVNLNYEGTIVSNNHFYIDKTIYTDCYGKHKEDGECAYAEDAIDIKAGSNNPDNPIILTDNIMWGFRKSDTTNSDLSDPGAAMPIHFGVKNLVIKDNIIFDTEVGFTIAGIRDYDFVMSDVVIKNNIFYDIKKFAIQMFDSKNVEITDNLFKNVSIKQSNWFISQNSQNINLSDNIIINTHDKNVQIDNLNEHKIQHNILLNAELNTQPQTNGTTSQYKDFVFTTDRYTNHSRDIKIANILK